MRVLAFFSLLLISLSACGPNADTGGESGTINADTTIQTTPDYLIVPGERIGGIGQDPTEAELREAYGNDQVKQDSIYVGEGQFMTGVIILPGTDNAVEVPFDETGQAVYARISQPGSDWATSDDIRIGSSLADLQKANGAPFAFYGFDWDYGGTVADWKGGQFPNGFIIRLERRNAGDQPTPEFMLGENLVNSDDERLQGMDIYVDEIIQRLDMNEE